MNQKIITILERFGLEEKEVFLYLTALEFGASGMTKLAKKANIKRSTAYTIYDVLERKGLMLSQKQKSGMEYFANPPQILVKKLKQNIKDVESILPELKALDGGNVKAPRFSYYEGVDNYKRILEETLSVSNSEVLMIGDLSPVLELLGEKFDREYYIPKRIVNNISARAILVKNNPVVIPDKFSEKQILRQIKFLPDSSSFNTFLVIYGDVVVTVHVGDDIYITRIEAKYFAEDERSKFDLMWGSL